MTQTDGRWVLPKLFTHDDISGEFVSPDVRGSGDQNAFEFP
jgi:hypothetical protein